MVRGHVAGPFTQPDFRFVPGAIAVHIHSFSASTLRDPNADWVGPLADARARPRRIGNVYEPYLQLTPHLDIFNDRLLHGFTFAESAYMSMPALSWMSVMVGDPLYRPYASWMQIDRNAIRQRRFDWQMYHDFAVQEFSSKPPAEYRTLARQAASRARNGPMIEDLGLMETRDGNFAGRDQLFPAGRACYTKRDDILRVVLRKRTRWIKQRQAETRARTGREAFAHRFRTRRRVDRLLKKDRTEPERQDFADSGRAATPPHAASRPNFA